MNAPPRPESTEIRMTRLVFGASLFLTTALFFILALTQPTRLVFAALAGSSLVWAAGLLLLERVRGGWATSALLVVAAANLVIGPAEAGLRLAGFRYEAGIQFGYPRPYQFDPFEPHERLFWTFPPSARGINRYGVREQEVVVPKPAATVRVLFLGNSCTYQGAPRRIEKLLRRRIAGIECLNFAVPGYTSHQGRVLLEEYGDEIDPDMLVVSFGWNDRWLAWGATDEDKQPRIARGRAARIGRFVYQRWRLLQLARRILTPLFGSEAPLDVPRVPPQRFRDNLEAIARTAADRGIPVLFATEPSAHPARGVPAYIVKSRYAASDESALELMRLYNDITREAAAHPGRHLADLDSLLTYRADVERFFTADGIHFSRAGIEFVAAVEAEIIAPLLEQGGGRGTGP